MNKKIFFPVFIFIFYFSLEINAQNYNWVKSAGGAFIDYGLSCVTDNNHNILVTGMKYETGDFSGTSVSGYGIQDAFIAKYNSSGNLIWVRNMGGVSQDWGRGVAIDAMDNVYVTGYHGNTIYFSANDSLTSSGTDIFLVKYDSAGNLLWYRNAGGSSADEGHAVAVDPFGNVIITGRFLGTTNFSGTILTGGATNVFIAKYSSSGSLIWAKMGRSTSHCLGYAITTDASGNIYCTGKFSGPLTWGASTFYQNGGDDIFTAKFDSSGNIQWLNVSGGTTNIFSSSNDKDSGNGIVVDNNGFVYMSGSILDSIDSAIQSIILEKYTNSGTRLWTKHFGDTGLNQANGIALDSVGYPYIIGTFEGDINFGSGIISSTGNKDIFVAKFDSSGNNIWTEKSGGYNDDYGASVSLGKNGNVTTTGYIRSTATFGPITPTEFGATDIFVASQFNNVGLISNLSDNMENKKIIIFPNPNTGRFKIYAEDIKIERIEIFNFIGDIIYSNSEQEFLNSEIDLSKQPAGIYYLTAKTKKQIITSKIIKV